MLFTSGTSGVPILKSTNLRGAKYIGVSVVGRNLSAGQQENVVEVGLQFPFGVKVRQGVVVGNGNKVQAARHRCFDGQKQWAREPSVPCGSCRTHRCVPYACAGHRDTSRVQAVGAR